MNWGGELVLAGLALFCVLLSRSVGSPDHPRLPAGWSDTVPEQRAAAARFIKRYLLGVAVLLLIDAVVIGLLPWKISAAVITAGGIAALIVGGAGVRRFSAIRD